MALLASKLCVKHITVLRTILLAVARSLGKRDVCIGTVAKEIYNGIFIIILLISTPITCCAKMIASNATSSISSGVKELYSTVNKEIAYMHNYNYASIHVI